MRGIIETLQRQRMAEINNEVNPTNVELVPKSPRDRLRERYGETWDTKEVQEAFTVKGFIAPYVVVVRKSDNVKGTLEFSHNPRIYFNFQAN